MFDWRCGNRRFRVYHPSCELADLLPNVLQPDGSSHKEMAGEFHLQSAPGGWRLQTPASPPRVFRNPHRLIQALEYAAVRLALDDGQSCILHAALMSRPRGSLAILGPCRSGKSTLSLALWQAGWTWHCDDSCELVSEPQPVCLPLRRRVSLRPGSHRYLQADLRQSIQASPGFLATRKGWHFHPDQLTGSGPIHLPPLRGFVLLTGRKGEAPRQLDPIATLRALMPHSNAARRSLQEGLRHLSPWAGRLPLLQMNRRPLAEMVGHLELFLHSVTQDSQAEPRSRHQL